MPKDGRDRGGKRGSHEQRPDNDRGRKPKRARGLKKRRIVESFIGSLSALLIAVLIAAPIVGARRARKS
jgi:hypothetical protein